MNDINFAFPKDRRTVITFLKSSCVNRNKDNYIHKRTAKEKRNITDKYFLLIIEIIIKNMIFFFFLKNQIKNLKKKNQQV